jgi:iron complex outermembrane receptor protein
VVRTSTLAEGRNVQYGGAARLTARMKSGITWTSLTAFRKLDYLNINDADISELELTSVDFREFQHQISEELTVSQERQRVSWIGGLFLLQDDDHQPVHVQLGGPRLENVLDPHVEARSRALFAQSSFGLTRQVWMTAGLRYTHEDKTIDNTGELHTLDLPVQLVAGSSYAYSDAISHTALTPKLGLELRRPRALAYASATRGFKSGGFNFSSPQAGRGYAPEFAWSYEGGVKLTGLGTRATLNLAAFHTDYSDLQVQTPLMPGVIDISNAAKATIRGLEVESAAVLASSTSIGGHFSWLSARYDEYVAVGLGGITGNVRGNHLNNSPEWSGRLWLQWNGSVGRTQRLSVRGDGRFQSTVFFTPFNDRIQYQRAYALLDASAEYTPLRQWTFGVYARNLTNTDYITGSFGTPLPAFGGRPGPPRQIGFQVTVHK